jgi:hypothetical protein
MCKYSQKCKSKDDEAEKYKKEIPVGTDHIRFIEHDCIDESKFIPGLL